MDASRETITKFNELQFEILNIGWNGVLSRYHPDNNIDDPNAAETFKLYKLIYEDMKRRLKVQ